MPYSSVAELPQPVKDKLKGKKRRQWMHVFNSSYDRHGDESRAFAEAWATAQKLEKATQMSDFNFFLPIAKVNREKRTVSGYASTPTRDSDGEVVTLEAIKSALPGYMTYGNIREMHALKAVGVAEEANLDQTGLFLTARIVDDQAWQKCLEGVYKGFSIGGRKLAKSGNSITKLEMTEVSVVDRPSNPDCRITIAKAKKVLGADGYLLKAKLKLPPEQKALAKMATIVESLAKSPPAARDGLSLPAVEKKENVSPKDESDQNNKADDDSKVKCAAHGVVGCEKCKLEKDLTLTAKGKAHAEPDFASDDGSGAGAGQQADDKPAAKPASEVEKREFDAKEREGAAQSGAALPDGSFPIKNTSDLSNAIQAFGRAKDKAKAKAHIKSRARALGATGMLPEKWGKAAKAAARDRLNAALGLGQTSFLTLEKGMRVAGGLSYCFDSLRDAQRSLMLEGQREGGDKKDQALAKQLGSIAKQLAGIIGQKASHEADEAEGLTDVDDQFLNTILGESDMTQKVDDVHGDPLTNAVAEMMKRAAMPTRAQLLGKAQSDVKESRKAMKECRKALEEAHKMHKAAFLAKAAKGGKKPHDDDDDDDEFDHAGAMEKLQKAYGDLEKARTFGKAAMGKIAKAASSGMSGRSGQRGEEAGDGEGKFYQVPAGVKDLSPSDLATASPGGSGSGGAPPHYPVDGSVYSGKADDSSDLRKYAGKDGNIPPQVAQLLVEKASAAAELEALRRMPAAPSGGRRPFNFDISKINGSGSATPDTLRKSLFEGVDVQALNSGDEQAHTAASARVIGNFLTSGQFGKSVLDPSFRGAAGG